MRHYCACFHSTSSTMWLNESIFTKQQFFCSIFFDKDQLHSTSLDSTRLTQQGGQATRFFPRFCRVKNRVKKRVVLPGPNPCPLYLLAKKIQRCSFISRCGGKLSKILIKDKGKNGNGVKEKSLLHYFSTTKRIDRIQSRCTQYGEAKVLMA